MADIDSDGDGLISYQEALEYAREKSPINDPDQKNFSTATILKVKSAAATVSANLSDGARSFLDDQQPPDGAVQKVSGAVKDWVWGTIVVPLFEAFWLIPIGIAAALGMVFWGPDLAVYAHGVVGWPGLADLPILVSDLLISSTAPIGTSILAFVYSTNQSVVSEITQSAGGFAPPLILAWQVGTMGLMLALLWSGVRLASSLPVVSTIVAGADVVTKPLRTALAGVFKR